MEFILAILFMKMKSGPLIKLQTSQSFYLRLLRQGGLGSGLGGSQGPGSTGQADRGVQIASSGQGRSQGAVEGIPCPYAIHSLYGKGWDLPGAFFGYQHDPGLTKGDDGRL